MTLGQHQQGREHIIADRILVAAGRAEEGDVARRQQRLVDVIGTYGGGADEPEPRAGGEELGIDPGHGAHQQHVGILQIRRLHLPSWQGDHLAKFGKQLKGVGHIFINDDLHRALSLRNRPQARHSSPNQQNFQMLIRP